MSQIHVSAITDPFPVRDEAAFRAEMNAFGVTVRTINDNDNRLMIAEDAHGEGFPTYRTVIDEHGNETEEEVDDFIEDVLVKHIAPGAIGVAREVSHEDGCSTEGSSAAFNSDGIIAALNLQDVREVAIAKIAAASK